MGPCRSIGDLVPSSQIPTAIQFGYGTRPRCPVTWTLDRCNECPTHKRLSPRAARGVAREQSMTDDERYCLIRLEGWLRRFNAIHFAATNRPELARAMYKALKADLITERMSVKRVRRDPPLTKAEQKYYFRAIRDS